MDSITRRLDFYTDGSWSSKSDMGGWACICVENGLIIDIQQGFEAYTTNNRMELKAFLSALESIKTIISPEHVDIHIHTDSAYVLGAFSEWYKVWLANNWKTSDKQDVKNQDILMPAVATYIKVKATCPFLVIEKVKAHKKKDLTEENEYNNYVDKLAVKQRKLLEDAE